MILIVKSRRPWFQLPGLDTATSDVDDFVWK